MRRIVRDGLAGHYTHEAQACQQEHEAGRHVNREQRVSQGCHLPEQYGEQEVNANHNHVATDHVENLLDACLHSGCQYLGHDPGAAQVRGELLDAVQRPAAHQPPPSHICNIK